MDEACGAGQLLLLTHFTLHAEMLVVHIADGADHAQGAIGIVPERREVRLAMALTHLTGLFVLAD